MAPHISKGKGKSSASALPPPEVDLHLSENLFRQSYSQIFVTKTELIDATGANQRQLIVQLGEQLVRSCLLLSSSPLADSSFRNVSGVFLTGWRRQPPVFASWTTSSLSPIGPLSSDPSHLLHSLLTVGPLIPSARASNGFISLLRKSKR